MVPKIHAKGSSFKGAAAYLLHDKERAKTNQRVAWTETRNLATGNPHVAWKVMAATAMDQQRLKEEAGVKKTGRKSVDAVLHLSLSWHKRDKENIAREEMVKAAQGAIHALGAEDRQAIFVCHQDEPHPHIHILVNRVSMEDGRMLSSSKEKLALSKWAEEYEKQRGQIDCPDRVINNEARGRGEYTRGKKNRSRNILESELANDNTTPAKAVREQQRQKDADVSRKARAQHERDKKAWVEIQQEHRRRQSELKESARRQTEISKGEIRGRLRPEWEKLFHDQQAGMKAFLDREKSLLGRVHNALRAVDFKAIMRGETGSPEGRTRRHALGEAFDAIGNAGVRLEALKRQQEQDKKELEIRQKREEREEAKRILAARDATLQANRERFEKQRNDRILVQQMEGAKIRAERLTRAQQRKSAWEDYRGRNAKPPTPMIEKVVSPPARLSEVPSDRKSVV